MTRRPWTVDELAEYLGIPKATLYVWRHRGLGPRGFRAGRHLRFRDEAVQKWIAEQEAASG